MALALFGCAERSPQQQVIPAILDDNVARVEVLMNDTANVDVNWRAGGDSITALIAAAGHNRLEIAELLLDRGADPNLSTAEGMSPIYVATTGGNEDMVRLLLASGADPNPQETRHGFSPLAIASSKGYAEIVRILLDAGADRSAKIKDGRNAMDLARHFGHTETLHVLTTYVPGSAKSPVE